MSHVESCAPSVHTVKNDKITRERFFYEGNW